MIIEKAKTENKDFFIALCKCTHFSNYYLKFNEPTIEDWENYLYDLATKNYNSKQIIMEKLNKGYKHDQTILYTRKK